ncbi:XkdQ/YqbQ family protein [Paenibacillus sp. IHBB 10380]|uniref:XkdQ/YqbQ family protein n=1 Tax=Paenibacillus sp. IHBB 10380 TaxID=1566358 RepID=UPI0005CFC166|nr:hypothetical protein [Paenibacillus sp. IHBB 10380]AJS59849.1 phage-like element PBSX protein XkdQ [Paenibacillus sp. IHBB 10380]
MELLIDNKDGNVWDVSDIATDISYRTSRIGKASSLEFTIIDQGIYQNKKFKYQNGDIVRFKDGSNNVFLGYIFKLETGLNGEAKILAYDQMRYLNVSHTYKFEKMAATQIIQKIAKDFELKVGSLDDTAYKIPALLFDNKTLFDMICESLDKTLIANTTNFVFFDDFGKLTLRNTSDMKYGFMIGEGSLMTDYTYSKSIDDDTYNQIVLYKDNKKSGKRETFKIKDSNTIKKWGLLQLYQNVDEKLNTAQINDMLTRLIAVKNRENRTMKIEAIGDFRLRAGMYVNIYIERFGINKFFLVDECTHKKSGANHTMSLELRLV